MPNQYIGRDASRRDSQFNRPTNSNVIDPQYGRQTTPNATNMATAIAQPQATPGAVGNATSPTVPPSPNVATNLQNLLQSGGAYLTQARQQGLQSAAQRGLSDSSIAAQASQGEAIRAALPIAQQDAQTTAQQQEAERQRGFQREQTALTTSANLQGQYVQQTQGLLNQYAISINEIETAQNIPTNEKNTMIRNEIARRDADLKFLRNMFNALPTWQPNWTTLPRFPDAPGVR